MSVVVTVDAVEQINYAAAEGGELLVRKVEIQDPEIKKAVCRITAVPEFIYEYKTEIELQNGKAQIDAPPLKLNHGCFRQEFIEAKEGEIQIEILDFEEQERILGFKNVPVHIQPYLHWDGWHHAYTLSAFMQPNDPYVMKVLKRAGEYADENGIFMSGYQSGRPEDVCRQAECIYRAIQDENVHYISSPPSFEQAGQKIRIPHQVLHDEVKQGTCLDLAILYASCLEAASLHGVLVVIDGHAFSGVWRNEHTGLSRHFVMKDSLTEKDRSQMREDLLPIECTTMTDGTGTPFSQACEIAAGNMERLCYIQDVHKAREQGIYPVFAFVDKPICNTGDEKEGEDAGGLTEKEHERLAQLRKQAMNITFSNRLLSGKKDRSELTFPINTELFLKYGYTNENLDMQIKKYLGENGMEEKQISECLQRLRIGDLEKKRETGKGSLYLAVNELLWQRADSGEKGRAPLYLCPAEVYLSKRGEYCLRVDPEGLRFNPVLKGMLLEDYNIDIADLLNQPGDQYVMQMKLLEYRVEKQKGWTVTENTARLSLYTIPDEAIWECLASGELSRHEIVRGILQGNMFWNNKLDEEPADENTIYAFPADSSQEEIVDSAFKRKTQVVIGPAGNGKSQTIANIMAEAVRKDQKVLFVSEKVSALEVEKRMMEQAGLGKFCLEIVEGKHKASDVSRQILDTLNYLDQYEYYGDNWEERQEQYEKRYRTAGEELKKLYEFMTEKRECGKSLEELLELQGTCDSSEMILPLDDAVGRADMGEAEDILEILAEIMKYWNGGQDYTQYLNFSRKGDPEVEEAVDRVCRDGRKLLESMETLAEKLELPLECPDKEKIKIIGSYASALRQIPVFYKPLDVVFTKNTGEEEALRDKILRFLEKEEDKGFFKFIQKSYENDLRELLAPVMSNNEFRNFKNLSSLEEKRRYIRNLDLAPCFRDEKESSQSRQEKEQYVILQNRLSEMNRPETEIRQIKKMAEKIAESDPLELKPAAESFMETFHAFQKAQSAAEQLIVSDLSGFQKDHPDEMKLVLFEEWKKKGRSSKTLENYQGLKKKARTVGMESFVERIRQGVEHGSIRPEQIGRIFKRSWCEHNIHKIYDCFPELREAGGIEYGLAIEKYRRNAENARKMLQKNLVCLEMGRLPRPEDGATDMPEVGKINKMVRKRGKAAPIRKYFEEVPGYLCRLFPCMLMNPSAVAEYMPWDFPRFDMVIIDEGSQMPTYKALPAIAHGQRCFIFGDEKQLTPTRFFKKTQQDDTGDVITVDSILEDAISTSMPRKLLRFHYRSQYESLIAFSNYKYYNGEIITFPSCNTAPLQGLSYVYVQDGCYDRGGTATNQLEAERTVEEVLKICAGIPRNSGETVGVITFNLAQKNLIQTLLMQKAMEDLEASRDIDEIVSVVNLESCQGKEWDYVVISTGYGPDQKGNFSVNLGTLNQSEGGSRLNVMLTRARKGMWVVTSMLPEMLGQSDKPGVKDLRDFLAYVRGDIQYDRREEKADRKNRGLTETIAGELRKMGYQVHTNIGSGKCKVDIGIVSEENPREYILGILLDHFREFRHRIRDRELIFPEILRTKGWDLYHLHAVSWYENPDAELDQIREILEKR